MTHLLHASRRLFVNNTASIFRVTPLVTRFSTTGLKASSQEESSSIMQAAMKAVEKASDAVPDVLTKNVPTPAGYVPPQRQEVQPGIEAEMNPKPEFIKPEYKGSEKLKDKIALITGGDSGIGRAVAVHFAREGAKGICIVYKGGEEDKDAQETVRLVEAEGAQCIALVANVQDPEACQRAVDTCVKDFGRVDILVNNAAEQHFRHSIAEITPEQLESTFATNVFGMVYMAKAAIPHMQRNSSIINTTSVTSYMGEGELVDYSATKGSIVAFTRSLSLQLHEKGIRVNAVAPGPIWTPLIPATFPKAAQLPWQTMPPMKRPGQPSEVAPCYVHLASEDGSYFAGQVLHPNGGIPVNS